MKFNKDQQDTDIEAVKRAADGQGKSRRLVHASIEEINAIPMQHMAFDRSTVHTGSPEDCEICNKYIVSHMSPDGHTEHKGLQKDCHTCTKLTALLTADRKAYNAVEPPHYKRGPKVIVDIGSQITTGLSKFTYTIQCVDVFRRMQDPRLATAFKYIWRVAFGGKCEPGMEDVPQEVRDERDINSAIWYLRDYVANPPESPARESSVQYTGEQVLVTDGENVVAVHDSESE